MIFRCRCEFIRTVQVPAVGALGDPHLQFPDLSILITNYKDYSMEAFCRQSWCLCGLPFDAVDTSSAISALKRAIKEDVPFFLSTPNLNFLMAAQTDSAFRESVINSDLSIADGMPLIWMSRLLNIPLPERVAGSSLMEALFADKNTSPMRVYFFGGEPGVGERACQVINQAGAGLQAVGHYCPGFGSIEEMSTREVIDEINRHEIDFLIVSLGAKKGQAWIEKNRHQLKAPAISHLGAVINFFAGTVKRAPVWMQRVGLEWLWRILEEPSLWKRYFFDGLELVQYLRSNSARKARLTNCKLVLSKRSVFFHNLRHFSSQANERSTTQRCGMTAKV